IWLASYPKSGNTWLRSIISSLVYTEDGKFDFKILRKIDQFPEKKYFKDLVDNFSFEEVKNNWILAQDKINLDGKVKFFKTHSGRYTVQKKNFTNQENTLGTVYIVRDPRVVIQSVSNHYELSIEESYKFISTPQMTGNGDSYENRNFGIFNLLGKWDDHYRSWTKNKEN
uniref:sulfotransferase domain-containing protein n=1 Tax=Pelagibacter ubique TaxID=198252 RepID=UPI000B0EE259